MTRNARLLSLCAGCRCPALGVIPVAIARPMRHDSSARPATPMLLVRALRTVGRAGQRCPALLRHSFTPIQGGAPQSMCQYQGKVAAGREHREPVRLHAAVRRARGALPQVQGARLVVIGFPSNDFGGQEPGIEQGDRRVLPDRVRRSVPDVREASASASWRRTRCTAS